MELIYFSLAIITILLAHGIRIYRWKQFICIYEKPNDANLLAALAIGYFLNFLFFCVFCFYYAHFPLIL